MKPTTHYALPRTSKAIVLFCIIYGVLSAGWGYAQVNDKLEFRLDLTSPVTPLPKIFTPAIDLSGRGFHRQRTWPQSLAAPEALDTWEKEIGFKGLYRMQYDLWEVHELAKVKQAQDELLNNYESIIKRISDAGGTVILNIFGTPAGLGKVLDKRSVPYDPKAYKELVKNLVRYLSCEKKYNVWYELWNAPDLDSFFLGRKQEYFALYREVSSGIQELERETKIRIPLGGPGSSWWFQNFDNNTIAIPERSLIYEFIKYCYHFRLKLDFISWHSYTSDCRADWDTTRYQKNAVALIREWLSYFHFDRRLPLIVEEWNFDEGVNISGPRGEKAYMTASFIPARLKNMYEADISYGVYYCLEDFHDNTAGVSRNLGVFSFEQGIGQYQGLPKASFNAFRMLSMLKDGRLRVSSAAEDEFVGVVATKGGQEIVILAYNYIDPALVKSYLSRSIGKLREGERKILLALIRNKKFDQILERKLPLRKVSLTRKLRALFTSALELHEKAKKFLLNPRPVTLYLNNLKGDYTYKRLTVDSSCSHACVFYPVEEKLLSGSQEYEEKLMLAPYSVELIVLQKNPLPPAQPLPGKAPLAASEGGVNNSQDAPAQNLTP